MKEWFQARTPAQRGLITLGLLVCWCLLLPRFVLLLTTTELRDFAQEWTSIRNYETGRFDIYENQHRSLAYHIGFPRHPKEHVLRLNAHPPTSILMCLPLASLDYSTALLVFNLVSLLALSLAIALLVRELQLPFGWPGLCLTVTAILWLSNFGPLRSQLEHGQWNLLLLLLFTGIWAADRNDQALLAGCLLGLAAAIKLFPGLLFVYFLVRRQWRVVLWGGGSFALWSLFTLAVLGSDTYRDYFLEVMPKVSSQFRSCQFSISLPALWRKLFDPHNPYVGVAPLILNPTLAGALILGTGIVILSLVAWVAARAQTREERDRAFGLALIALPLLSPIAWDHYLLFLLLPILRLLAFPPASRWLRGWSWVVAFFLSLHPKLYTIPFFWDLHGEDDKSWVSQPVHVLTFLASYTYALLGLFALEVYLAKPWSGRQTSLPTSRDRTVRGPLSAQAVPALGS